MSASTTAQVEQGARELVENAQRLLQKMIVEPGPGTSFSVTNSIYYLPLNLAYSAKPAEGIGDLQAVVQRTQSLKSSQPVLAALLAAEATEALRNIQRALPHAPDANGVTFASTISDAQVRSWGVQMADGRMPGVALLIGSARNNAWSAALVQELRRHNILCLLSGESKGAAIQDQLKAEGIELGEGTSIVPLGKQATSAANALGFLARCAMKLAGHKPGSWAEIQQFCTRRTPGFVLALGELDDQSWAMALAAQGFGFSIIADTAPAGMEQVASMPYETLPGTSDGEKIAHLVEQCVAKRGLKLTQFDVPVAVAYGPAFEEENILDADLYVQFGGGGASAFELLQTATKAEVTDGKVDVIGPDLSSLSSPNAASLGLVIHVAGKKLDADFEAYLERQIHTFLNYASGIQHAANRDEILIRVSKAAVAQGLTLESLGRLLQARFHEEYPAVEKIQVTVITDANALLKWKASAQAVHAARSQRIAQLRDSDVDEFYVCTNCRTFAPTIISIISPERVSPCGQCNWFDARAGYALHRASVRRPLKRGKAIDEEKGIWEGTNEYAKKASHGRVSEVALYSIAETPMCACGDFECIVMLIPEVNGVMVVAHDDASNTPAGINVDTFASIAAGEQIPGVAGIGKSHLLSPKFIAADGGFRRVVWMSSSLKTGMAQELQAVCEREGEPDLMDKIADERQVTSVEQLVKWVTEHQHPVLQMEKAF